MTQKVLSKSFMIIKSSVLVFGMTVAMSIPTNAETVKMTGEKSADGSFILAQTAGMDRRQDRRDTRQDCRQAEGIVGADKRDCKQQGRQERTTTPAPAPAPAK